MKYIVIFLLALISNLVVAQSQEGPIETVVKYVKPYTHKTVDNNLLVKAYINDNDFHKIALEDGYKSQIKKVNDTSWLWLPAIGKAQNIKIYHSKGKYTEQLFTPLVPEDWDFFKEGTFHIISSSHQDIAWMDTPAVCRHDRVNEIIAPALDMMKTDKDFHFGMEQTLNLKEFIEDFPDRKKEVIQRANEGRFSWGATYNQPYEGMQTGEQLIREMYFGRLWLKNNFEGNDVLTAFNTDVPGRTLQLPQILAKSGVENLFVSRMKEGFFDWYSPDGSSIPTYSPGNYGWAAIFYKLFEEDAIESMHLLHSRVKMWSEYYKEHNLPPHFAIVISNDGVGPANYSEIVKQWNIIIATTGAKIPALKHSTVTSFMNEVKKPNAKFDKVEGERPNIWSYIHGPGHHKAITASRKSGRMLPSAEIFSTIDALLKGSFADYPKEDLDNAFEESIYPDHGWGGKNGDVTDSIFRAKLEFAADESDRLINLSLNSISKNVQTKHDNAIIVYNDLSWERNGTASIEVKNNGLHYYVVDEEGKVVPSQMSINKSKKILEFEAGNVPSIGYQTYYLKQGNKKQMVEKTVSPNSLENNFYSLRLGNGGITYLYDRSLSKEVIKSTRFSGGDVLTMGYHGNGAGEFTQMTKPTMDGYDKTSSHTSQWKIVSDGALFTQFKNEMAFEHAQIIQYIKVYHHIKKIDFSIDILNWDGTHNREFRFALPLNMENATIKYEVPLAIAEVGKSEMKKAPKGWAWGGTYDQMPSEIHPREVMNFIASENEDFAVTMATDVALADWIDPTREAAEYTVLQGLLMASHKSCHGEGNWYHQTGDHHFSFSMTSHTPSDNTSYKFGNTSNHALRTVVKKEKDADASLPSKMSFFAVSDPMVRISTIKKSEADDAVIIRLVEMGGNNSTPTISLPKAVKAVYKTNLIEEEPENLKLQGSNIKLDMGHNAIETFKIIIK